MPKSIIINVRLSPEDDKEVIEKICSSGSASGYVKSLIAKDIGMDYPTGAFFTRQKSDPAQISSLHICLNLVTESKIIEKLNSVQNKSEYIRMLVKEDIGTIKSKSWEQLSNEINISEYADLSVYAASRFSELSEILRSNGFLTRASECSKLADLLTAWASETE